MSQVSGVESFSDKNEDTVTHSAVVPSDAVVLVPQIKGPLKPSEAIREVLSSDYGKGKPRSMADIINVLQTNALYFSDGAISGALSYMTKNSVLRRWEENGKWVYVLNELTVTKRSETGK